MSSQLASIVILDAQISTLEEQLLDLKRKRNSLLGISQIPVELLAKIFLELETDNIDELPTALEDTIQQGRVTATHVCSRWREVGLNCVHLWSHICSDLGSAGVEAASIRSKQAPISIDYRHHEEDILDKWTRSLSNVLSQSNRLQEISVYCKKQGRKPALFFSGLFKPLRSSTPLLQRLSIINEMVHANIVLPRQFLDDDTPRLQHLSLIQCYLPWNSGLFQACLTTLHIELAREHSYHGSDVNLKYLSIWPTQILTALQKTPHLRELYLALPGVVPTDTTGLNQGRLSVVSLPCLEDFTLIGGTAAMSCFATSIRFPPASAYPRQAGIFCDTANDADVQSFLQAMTPAWLANSPPNADPTSASTPPSPSTSPIQKLRLRARSKDIYISGWGPHPDHEAVKPSNFCFGIFSPFDTDWWSAPFCPLIARILPLHTLVLFDVKGISAQAWRLLSPLLTSLQHIILHHSEAFDFVEHFREASLDMPLLEQIHFHRMRLDADSTDSLGDTFRRRKESKSCREMKQVLLRYSSDYIGQVHHISGELEASWAGLVERVVVEVDVENNSDDSDYNDE